MRAPSQVGSAEAEMQKRFEAARKVRVSETPLRRPPLAPDVASLRAHFSSRAGQAPRDLENPHLEPRVTPEERKRATPAAVLVGLVSRESGLSVIVTRRHPDISYPGHWVFPGGRADVNDATPFQTALRETQEEIGLEPDRVELIGRLGDYVSHSGYRIAPIVGLVKPPAKWRLHPGEVEALAEVELRRILDCNSYFLYRFPGREDRAHFALDLPRRGNEEGDLWLTGVTASLCIGLYAELAESRIEKVLKPG